MCQLQVRVLIMCCVAGSPVFCSDACGQVVQSPGWPAVGAAVTVPHPGQIGPHGIVFDRPGVPGPGRRSGVNVIVPGPIPYARRGGIQGQSGAQYSVPQVDAQAGMTVRTYSSRPHSAIYSAPPVQVYTVPPAYNDGIHYHGGYSGVLHEVQPGGSHSGRLHPYDQAQIERGQAVRFPPGYGPQDRGIVAPAVVSPYGGLFSAEIPSPAPHSFPPPVPVPYSVVPVVPQQGTNELPAVPVDRRPIVGEFAIGSATEQQADDGVVELIRSLRSQTSGDMAFRRQDYTSAEHHYETATEITPSRRAAWLRLTWAHVAQQRFADAAVSLKSGMHAENADPARAWISGGLLFGDGIDTVATVQNNELWKWLNERPNSTDRLMLTAGFQHLLGFTGVAQELLAVAVKNGLPEALHGEMRSTFRETHHNRDLHDLPAFAEPPATGDNGGTVDAASNNAAEVDGVGNPETQPNSENPDVLTLPDPDRPPESESRNVDGSSVPVIPRAVRPTPK